MGLADNLAAIQQRIADACGRAGRDPGAVSLLAVSKGMPPEAIREATEAGLKVFGESKVQEARAKMPLCPTGLRWHMIGHLQSNKCRDAVRLFDLIEGVDSLALAQELNKWAEKEAKTLPILLELNLAGESTKFGFRPEQALADLAAINALPRIEVHGFMTIAPWSPDPEKARPIFRRMHEMKERGEALLGAPLPHLSMGMSGDFETAIEEGATIVRLGTLLFGTRPRGAKITSPADEA